jgi:hypothetical protein
MIIHEILRFFVFLYKTTNLRKDKLLFVIFLNVFHFHKNINSLLQPLIIQQNLHHKNTFEIKIINIKDNVSIENSIIGIPPLKPLIFFDMTVIDLFLPPDNTL